MVETTPQQYVNLFLHHDRQARQWRDVATSFRDTRVGDAEERETAATLADAMAERDDFLAREALENAAGAA
jgi:hypothetical protein